MESFKKHYVVILAFLLPILLIAGITLTAYVPASLLSTDYDFVYATCGEDVEFHFGCNNYLRALYSVEESALVINEVNPDQDSDKDLIPDINENYTTRLFLHDTTNNVSRELLLSEAQALELRPLLTSPDGVNFEDGYSGSTDFFFFGNNSQFGYYLTEGSKRQRQNIVGSDDRYYRDGVMFLGWVIE